MIYASDLWNGFLLFGYFFGLVGMTGCFALGIVALIHGEAKEKLLCLLFFALIPVFMLWYNAGVIEKDDYRQRDVITHEYINNLSKTEKIGDCICETKSGK